MSEFDDLKRALDDATPEPDAARRAENLALAMKNFDSLQGKTTEARPTPEDPENRGFRGVIAMLTKTLSSRGVLTASTALAAVALVAVIPVLQEVPFSKAGNDIAAKPEAAVLPQEPVTEPLVLSPSRTEDAQDLADTHALEFEPVIVMEEAAGAPAPRMMTREAAPFAGGLAKAAPAPQILQDGLLLAPEDTEAYPEAESNPIKVTTEEPVSTFSIDVDTASWSIIRNSLSFGRLPPEGAVRIEEMINYFPYDYPSPQGAEPFRASLGVMDSPWREGTQLVHIGLQGAMPEARPPLNLVFLIDTSGSMSDPNKLPLLKQSFRLLLGQLNAEDSVSIVTYAGSAGRVLEPTPASERQTILDALERLDAGGSTAGQAGLQLAYATAEAMAEDGKVSRVILATDGDFNVGISDPDALKNYIADKRETGTYLSILGFGRGNLDDATMQALAQTGNGMAAYIDTLAEAQKVLVDQLTGALVPIADDVKIQVEWNPALVAEYRLIGYETRALRREDFNNDKVDAGEIGAGHQVTALYEITPVGSEARLTDPLRYDRAALSPESDELGFLKLRYKAPGESVSQLVQTPIMADTAPLPDADFAAAIAGFGQLLQGSDLIGDYTFDDAINAATAARGDDPFGYRQEAVTLMRLAQSLSK
ncbi:vWA domain-containing protein [Pacificoceanicola onchidii]|uniref:vWA domain-containing protein n=1 Tax=Pacificoceanicola onchidii TaxID=2562685 RepID=UPI0010A41E59|nr:VWA domain-containing protein [Pacificoceanicola onchidii]